MNTRRWWSVLALGGGLALLAYAERRRPLRRRVEPELVRIGRNVTELALSSVVVRTLQDPYLEPFAHWCQARRIGLARWLGGPLWLRRLIAFLLLDYTLWWWHYANHRVPFLWRFHLVHHIDRDLDFTTAARFHFGEMAMSVPVRFAQVAISGADVETLRAWQTILMLCIGFQHSNVDVGEETDRFLADVVVTPRMHGIHHSDVLAHTDSNWSSILTIWDRLHRTLLLDVPQESITIGVPAYQDEDRVTIGEITTLPFRRDVTLWE